MSEPVDTAALRALADEIRKTHGLSLNMTDELAALFDQWGWATTPDAMDALCDEVDRVRELATRVIAAEQRATDAEATVATVRTYAQRLRRSTNGPRKAVGYHLRTVLDGEEEAEV